jgi:hypothetical protein
MSTHMCLDCDSPGDGNCPFCHGIGRLPGENFSSMSGGIGDEISCASCDGTGECRKCEGSGEIEVGGEG